MGEYLLESLIEKGKRPKSVTHKRSLVFVVGPTQTEMSPKRRKESGKEREGWMKRQPRTIMTVKSVFMLMGL